MIFARSASAVTPSEKSLIITKRKSTTRFPTSLRWIPYARMSATTFLYVKTVSNEILRHSLTYLTVKMVCVDVPLYSYVKFKNDIRCKSCNLLKENYSSDCVVDGMVYFQTFSRNGPEAAEFGKITQNNGHYAVEGHSRSPILVLTESPYATSD